MLTVIIQEVINVRRCFELSFHIYLKYFASITKWELHVINNRPESKSSFKDIYLYVHTYDVHLSF